MSGLADAVALLHVAFVAFVLVGFAAMAIGDGLRWRWTRNPWLRAPHAAAIGYTLVRTWLAASCPLTVLEERLRGDGAVTSAASWSHRLFFKGADHRQFTLAVTVFAAIVFAQLLWTLRRRTLR